MAKRRWWGGAFGVLALAGAAWASPTVGPFTLLAGQEVARTPAIRDLALTAFGFVHDGSVILAADADGPAILDERGQVRAAPRCPAAPAGVATLDTVGSKDGGLVAALFANGRACVWDGLGKTLLGSKGRNITEVALGDADTLVFGHASGLVEGRNPRTGRRRWGRDADLGRVVQLRFDAQGQRVAASSDGLGVAVFDSRWGRLVRAIRGEPAWSAAFDPAGDRLAVGRADGRVELWNTTTWRARDSVSFGEGRVIDLDFSPDGGQLAAATETGEGADRVVMLQVWDFAVGELVFREQAPAGPGPTRFRYDAVGYRLVAGNGAGVSRLWGKPGARSIPRPLPSDEPPHMRLGPDDMVYPPLAPVAVASVHAGTRVVSDDATRVLVQAPPPEAAEPVAVAEPVSPHHIPNGGAPHLGKGPPRGAPVPPEPPPADVLTVLDVASGAPHPLQDSSGVVGPFALSPDGRRAAAWGGGAVRFWDTASGAILGRFEGPRPRAIALGGERALVVTADGTVVIGGADGRLRAIAGATGATTAALDPAHASRVALGTEDGEVRVVDVRKGTALGSWGLHGGAVSAVAFSADGRHLASAGPRPGGDGAAVIVLAADRDQEEDPWSVVLDTLPAHLRFSGDAERVLAVSAGEVAVVDHTAGADHAAAAVLDLSVPAVDAAFAEGPPTATPSAATPSAATPVPGVTWVDTDGAARHVVIGATLPWVPRGRAFAISDDGRYAVSVDADRVSVWDDETGRHLRELPGTGEAVLRCVFDDSGASLAVLYADRSVEVYDVATGEAIRHLDGPPAGTWLRFSDDGAVLWLQAGPREVVGWAIATGLARERVDVPGTGALAVDEAIGRGRFVHLAATGSAPGAPPDDAWIDTAAVSAVRLTTPADGLRPLAIPPKGDHLAVVEDGAIARVDASSRHRVGPLLRVEGDTPANAAAFSPDGGLLAVAYAGGLIRVWDLERNAVVVSLGADAAQVGRHVAPVASLAFDAAGEIVTARDLTGHARLWEWKTSMEGPAFGVGTGPVEVSTDIPALAISPDGKRLYSAHGDADIRAWSVVTGEQLAFFAGHAGRVTSLAVAADGHRLVSGSEDGTVRAWDSELAIEKLAVSTFGDPVRRVVASADGWRLAAVGDGGVLRTWDGAVGKKLKRWQVTGGVAGLDLGAAGAKLGVLLAGGGAWTLDPVTGAMAARDGSDAGAAGDGAPPRNAPPGGAPLDPPGTSDVAAPIDPVVALRVLARGLSPVTAEVRTPDGATLITAGADGRIRLWDVASRSLRGTLTALTDGSWVIDRPDGTRFASESLRDGTSPLLHQPPPR